MINVTPCEPQQTTVALLFGGKSSERDISIKSAEAVSQALRSGGFNVVEIDTGEPHYIDKLEQLNPNIAFICLHGKGGEDGCVQGVCAELGIPFTYSGVLASALAMDKSKAKIIYNAHGINTPASIVVQPSESVEYEKVAAQLGAKVVVKQTNEGSSFGLYIVDTKEAFDQAIQAARDAHSAVVIEQFIVGTEITVAVIGNDEVMAMPIIEIVPHAEFYDFEAKYAKGGSDHIIPARLNDNLTKQCQQMAIMAHKALGCLGVSRTDFLVDANDVPWVLETNTIPGMTATSLVPHAAQSIGIDFVQLCRLIVELGLEAAHK